MVGKEAKTRATKAKKQLGELYPDAECALDFQNPLELLVATILSAQCTDVRVNIVTKSLFKKYKSAADYAKAPVEELQRDIQSINFFRNKAKNIQACCQTLCDKYDGQVPKTMAELVQLAGVGRKTASVVLGTAYGLAEGVVVDTHVSRLSQRMGLTAQTDPGKIEQDLMQIVPKKEWIAFSHRLILHGRQICHARSPKCEQCVCQSWCPQLGIDS